MAKDDWYRRTTWTERDREEFHARLGRSRSPHNKAQYLRIQADYISRNGFHSEAIELLDQMFAECPEKSQLASAHLGKAKALGATGFFDAAVAEYRAALQSERELPNYRTTTWVDFPWDVVTRHRTDMFDEASKVLDEFRDDTNLKFLFHEYRYWAIRAVIAEHRGDTAMAGDCARRALAEAGKKHSGLRYHATVGLVKAQPKDIERRLRALAKATDKVDRPWWRIW